MTNEVDVERIRRVRLGRLSGVVVVERVEGGSRSPVG